jgi:ABC-type branched-subunit amino acid transport system ATPase component
MTILETKNLYKAFDGVLAVDNINLSIEKGSVSSLIGPNGAGKTSLFNVINGFISQDSGSILFKGKVIDNFSVSERALLGIGRLWQDIRLFNNMTVIENLLAAKKEQPGEKLFKNFFTYNRVLNSEKENLKLAEQTLEFLQLSDKRHSLAQNLSYGQQKLLAIGRLLMNDAELLLLDEPTAGVNSVMIDEILKVIKQLSETGKTIFLIEHNIPKALSISDWVYVMNQGKIELSDKPDYIYKTPELREIYITV